MLASQILLQLRFVTSVLKSKQKENPFAKSAHMTRMPLHLQLGLRELSSPQVEKLKVNLLHLHLCVVQLKGLVPFNQ